MDDSSFIGFTEKVTPTFSFTSQLEFVYHKEKSKYQEVGMIKTTDFGKTLLTDRWTQSADRDEFVYHESIIHPAMIAHACPKSVLIAGGGEGAAAREVLRHNTVERLVMVELDDVVVEVCKKYTPEWVAGCYDDPRMELVIGDAKVWIENTKEKFDVIILDISDPSEGGPSMTLFFQSFYKTIISKLTPDGIFVTQSGGGGLLTYTQCFTVIHNTMKVSFPKAYGYVAEVPSYGSPWGFNMGIKGNTKLPDKDEIDARINKRVTNPNALRFYDGLAHEGMFGLPKYIRKDLEKETRVMTETQQYYIQ